MIKTGYEVLVILFDVMRGEVLRGGCGMSRLTMINMRTVTYQCLSIDVGGGAEYAGDCVDE